MLKYILGLIIALGLILSAWLTTPQFIKNKKAPLAANPGKAIQTVKNLPEVIVYIQNTPNSQIRLDHEEDQNYIIQVYETKNGHTATFNWYKINKTTGTVQKEF
jgi:hypothetical protein